MRKITEILQNNRTHVIEVQQQLNINKPQFLGGHQASSNYCSKRSKLSVSSCKEYQMPPLKRLLGLPLSPASTVHCSCLLYCMSFNVFIDDPSHSLWIFACFAVLDLLIAIVFAAAQTFPARHSTDSET